MSRFKDDKVGLIIMIVYIVLCFISGIYSVVTKQLVDTLMSFGFIFFIPIILIIEKIFKIKIVPISLSLLLLVAIGSILGSCYNMYKLIPYFDTILHGISGFIFACFGFAIVEYFFTKSKTLKAYIGCIFCAVAFSLAIAVLWEIFEYTVTMTMQFDMTEDLIVTSFNSYYLSGSYEEVFIVEGILKTVIYLENGEIIVIDGYLDLGLGDTLHDLMICTGGAILFIVVMILDRLNHNSLKNIIIPKTKQTEQEIFY